MQRRVKDGFSLMEVNLAILLMAVGLMSLFALFPAALKESEKGIADTQEAMFADTILSTMEGNAMGITNWSIWANESTTDTNAFRKVVKQNIPYISSLLENVESTPIEFPADSGYVVRCKYVIGNNANRRRKVTLWVRYTRYGSFAEARVYDTELIYLGM